MISSFAVKSIAAGAARVAALAAFACLASAAWAQSSSESAPVPAIQAGFNFGANILVPRSNIPATGGKRGARYTNYLINSKPAKTPSLDDPIYPLLALHGPLAPPPIAGYHPSDMRSAYQMPANGGSYAVAVIDANNDPYVLADFNTFSSEFSLPVETSTNITAPTNETLQVVYANGIQPPNDRSWSGEISLDIQWVHAMAPNAKIYLVEAASATEAALDQAVQVAETLPNVKQITMSYGTDGEAPGEQSEDFVFTTPGIVYFAATGDIAGVRGYPALSPNVVAVGGTSIKIVNGAVTSDQVWTGGGAGDSIYVPRPAFQNGVANVVGNFRGSPDICADADPNTGVALYDTYEGGWIVAGGTSLASPVCAAITNVRLNYSESSPVELTRLYSQLGGGLLRDITVGSIQTLNPNTNKPTGEVLTAGVGYDLATGLGEPIGLYAPQSNSTVDAALLQNPVGRVLGGSVASLSAADDVSYVITSSYETGVGEVAGADVQYKLAIPTGGGVGSAMVKVTATTIYGAGVEVYAQNTTTGVYDDIGPVPIDVATSNGAVGIDPTKYVAANGTVNLRFRAIRPLRYGLSTFEFRLDRAIVQAIYTS